MQTNGMVVYAAWTDERFLHADSRNLFALCWDIHNFQFDFGNIVIIPLDGRMVTHFIGPSRESAALYYNKPFDSSNLLREFLFARFAWAILTFSPTADRETFSLKTANAAPLDEGEEVMGLDDGDGDEPVDP